MNASLPNVINALTMVITDANLRRGSRYDDILHRFLGTNKDLNEVDRCVYVSSEGVETYIKDRYPSATLPIGVLVIEHRMHRPQLLFEHLDTWVNNLRQARKNLKLNLLINDK